MAFKMKGFTFPGIKTEGYENMEDGRSKSSAFTKEWSCTPKNVVRALKESYGGLGKGIKKGAGEWKKILSRNKNK